MRDYKFRGRTDTGQWVTGDLRRAGGLFMVENLVVDPDTVGEWTGLWDMTGAEIYEGDIIACQTLTGGDRLLYVKWDMSTAGFLTEDLHVGSDDYLDDDCAFDAKVISNRWDTPELLRGNENG